MKQNENEFLDKGIQEAIWEKKRKTVSTVWIIPIVALIVGLWLIFENINAKGPEIKITFKSAEGIHADKTTIKYKDIEVGKVTDVVFSKDLSTVIVTAEMKKSMKPFLSENSKFWIKKAHFSINKVEGLDTLLSGVYIVIDPKKGKEKVREFKGLDSAPVIASDEKGRHFKLKADSIGSLSHGSPIYYKKLNAGQVTSYKLSDDGESVEVSIFIRHPFDKLVKAHTRFWNGSGINAYFSANGVEIQTESLTSILSGGLVFDNFTAHGKGDDVKEWHTFTLFNNIHEAKKKSYEKEMFFWIYFQNSVRGLSIGAPVEFRGVKIGEVVNYSLVGDSENANFKIPILIKIEPSRFMVFPKGQMVNTIKGNGIVLNRLVKKGFRAQLKSGNLVTGELFVDLNMHPDAPPANIKEENGLYVIPTVPSDIESIKSDLKSILDNIAAIPFERIGKELEMTIVSLRKETLPKLDATIESTDSMMKGANSSIRALQKNYLDNNAEVNRKILRLLEEMTKTSRSIKNLTDYLERHPESIIKGK